MGKPRPSPLGSNIYLTLPDFSDNSGHRLRVETKQHAQDAWSGRHPKQEKVQGKVFVQQQVQYKKNEYQNRNRIMLLLLEIIGFG